MSQEKQSQKKIEELEKREQELKKIIDQARGDVESLSIEKMEKMKAIMSEVDKEDSQLDEEREYLNSDKTKGNDIKEIEESGNEKQHQEINSIRRKIQRKFYNNEAKIGGPDRGIDEYKEEESKIETSPFIDYGKEYKNRKEYEGDKKRILSQKVSDLLDPLFSKNEEDTKRREANGNHFIKDNDSEPKENIKDIEEKKENIEIENTLDLTPEEEKILIEAEAQIKKEDEIISETEKKIAELKSRLKVVEFKKKKEEQEKSKEKAKNKKIKKKQEEAGGEVKKEESEEIVTEDSEIIQTEEVTGNEAKEIKKKIKPVPEDVEIETEEKIETKKEDSGEEVESFSTDFIKNKINELLLKIKQVKKINKLEIKGSNNNIEINTILRAKEGIISVGVNIGLVLTNKDENIVVKNYNIEAGALTSIIKPLITKQLDNVTELIKKYIEKERNKKVEKIWIEDGQLKVL